MGFPGKENKYRLELHWDKVSVLIGTGGLEDVFLLENAYFCGPVLKDAAQINPNDNIMLDTTFQHSIFVPSFYLSKFSWKNVIYSNDKVYLEDAYLVLKNINSIPKISDTDFFVINCSKHEEATHANYLTYEAYLVDENGEVYIY
jgi:hypothetical protein